MQFRKFIRIHWVLLALMLMGAAWLFQPVKIVTAKAKQQFFGKANGLALPFTVN